MFGEARIYGHDFETDTGHGGGGDYGGQIKVRGRLCEDVRRLRDP